MGNEKHPWKNERHPIKCCKGCVAPKRHPGCHDTCKEYKEQKAKHEESMKNEREYLANLRPITNFDFDRGKY